VAPRLLAACTCDGLCCGGTGGGVGRAPAFAILSMTPANVEYETGPAPACERSMARDCRHGATRQPEPISYGSKQRAHSIGGGTRAGYSQCSQTSCQRLHARIPAAVGTVFEEHSAQARRGRSKLAGEVGADGSFESLCGSRKCGRVAVALVGRGCGQGNSELNTLRGHCSRLADLVVGVPTAAATGVWYRSVPRRYKASLWAYHQQRQVCPWTSQFACRPPAFHQWKLCSGEPVGRHPQPSNA